MNQRADNNLMRQIYGGVALEYLLVSVFALLITVAGLALVGKTIRDKVQELSSRWGEDVGVDSLDAFTGEP